MALNPSLLACAGLGKLASNNRVWQEKDINFRVEKLGRHSLTEVFEVPVMLMSSTSNVCHHSNVVSSTSNPVDVTHLLMSTDKKITWSL